MKYALLSGASSGLGQALAYLLAQDGWSLGLVGRSSNRLQETCEKIKELGNQLPIVVETDLTHPEEVATVVARFGKPVDLLVNCAGGSITGTVEAIPSSEYQRCWHLNCGSAIQLVQQVLPQMKERNQGTIVNVTSGAALRSLPFSSPYGAAKAALNAFTDSLRSELSSTQIQVLLFSPGPVASRFHDNITHHGTQNLVYPPFHGQSSEKIAKCLYKAITKGRIRQTVGFKANVAKHLSYWSPRLTDWVVSRMYGTSS